ncbi:MAG: hypothetical protein ACXV2D_08945, partial [Halobacteriota archaeon]
CGMRKSSKRDRARANASGLEVASDALTKPPQHDSDSSTITRKAASSFQEMDKTLDTVKARLRTRTCCEEVKRLLITQFHFDTVEARVAPASTTWISIPFRVIGKTHNKNRALFVKAVTEDGARVQADMVAAKNNRFSRHGIQHLAFIQGSHA